MRIPSRPKRPLSRASLVLLSFLAVDCGPYVKRHADRGDAFFEQQKYREAIAEYVSATRFDPNNARLIKRLGVSYFRVGDLGAASQLLLKAESLDPKDADVRVTLGLIYVSDNHPDDAVREAEEVLKGDRTNVSALNLLSWASIQKRDYQKATDALGQLVAVSPNNAEAHTALGTVLVATGRAPEARTEFDTALALAPDSVQALQQLASLDLLEHHPEVAIARVQKQISVVGRTPKLVLLLASVQAAHPGDGAAAEASFHEAIRLDSKHSDAMIALANYYVASGNATAGLAMADSALAREKTPQAYQIRGILLDQRGDVEGARQSYEQALGLNPGYVPAANNLAVLLSEKLNDKRTAYNLAELAYRGAPDDPNVVDTFGWIIYKFDDFKRAAGLLKVSAQKLPGSPDVQYHYGMAALKAADTVEARNALTRAVNSSVQFADRESARQTLASLR